MNTADANRDVPQSVSLAQLVEVVPLAWFEAVAIVQELCAVLLALGPGAEGRVPNLDGIEITSAGTTVLAGKAPSGDGLSRLGRTMVALLTDDNRPVQLRLLVAEATESTPRYASIEEFSDALRYFERAGRTEMIRAVFERWQMLPADRRTLKRHPSDPAQPTDPAATAPASNPWTTRRMAYVAAVAAVAVVLLGTTALMMRRRGEEDASRGSFSTLASETTRVVVETVASGLSSLRETLGLANTLKVEPPPAPPPPAPEPRRRPRLTAVKKTASPPLVGPVIGEFLDSASLPNEGSGESLPEAPPATTNAPSSTVYSASDADVRPPIAIYPQLPTKIRPDLQARNIAVMELWISETGSVDRVRLRRGPNPILDGMLLSAAKTWQFQPAMRNGQPVKYRKEVSWMSDER